MRKITEKQAREIFEKGLGKISSICWLEFKQFIDNLKFARLITKVYDIYYDHGWINSRQDKREYKDPQRVEAETELEARRKFRQSPYSESITRIVEVDE